MWERSIRRPDSKCAHIMRVHSSGGGLCPLGRGRSLFVSGGSDKGKLDCFLIDACCVNSFSFLDYKIGFNGGGGRSGGKTHRTYGHT